MATAAAVAPVVVAPAAAVVPAAATVVAPAASGRCRKKMSAVAWRAWSHECSACEGAMRHRFSPVVDAEAVVAPAAVSAAAVSDAPTKTVGKQTERGDEAGLGIANHNNA